MTAFLPPINPPFSTRRRRLLMAAGLIGVPIGAASGNADALTVKRLVFPRDRGAHPEFRTEWWYITGYATAREREFGFQLTFFRTRTAGTQDMRSGFAAKQLLFAHAAVTDVSGQKLWHDQRIARTGFSVASASTTDMALRLRDWQLTSEGSTYQAHLPATEFGLKLQFTETQPVLLQGRDGLSRKGPQEQQASYYYSQPQLVTSGQLQIQGKSFDVRGTGWLDHEWSQELLHPTAIGWDWIGINLSNGGALTAFRLRDKDGASVWDGGSFRSVDQTLSVFRQGEVLFKPLRFWKSALSQTTYPVQWMVYTPQGTYTVTAVIDNQELDSRRSTGSIYWEGLSEVTDDKGQRIGRGYLEMTGYAAPLRL